MLATSRQAARYRRLVLDRAHQLPHILGLKYFSPPSPHTYHHSYFSSQEHHHHQQDYSPQQHGTGSHKHSRNHPAASQSTSWSTNAHAPRASYANFSDVIIYFFAVAIATAPSPVERISSAKVPATGKGSPKAKVLPTSLNSIIIIKYRMVYLS